MPEETPRTQIEETPDNRNLATSRWTDDPRAEWVGVSWYGVGGGAEGRVFIGAVPEYGGKILGGIKMTHKNSDGV